MVLILIFWKIYGALFRQWTCILNLTSHPESHTEQSKIADNFRKISSVGFVCCAGTIDGLLIWILKPTRVMYELLGLVNRISSV